MKPTINVEVEFLFDLLLDGYQGRFCSKLTDSKERTYKINSLLHAMANLDPNEEFCHKEVLPAKEMKDGIERVVLWTKTDWSRTEVLYHKQKREQEERVKEHEENKELLERLEAELGLPSSNPAFRIVAAKFLENREGFKKFLDEQERKDNETK